jgi:hypothetical protein
MAGVTRWDPFQELLLIEDDAPAPPQPAAGRPDPQGQHRDQPAPPRSNDLEPEQGSDR